MRIRGIYQKAVTKVSAMIHGGGEAALKELQRSPQYPSGK
jgi:hypothetical protein